MKFLVLMLRIIVGCLFIFSGLVKANDPLGLSYKTQEFFEKMHLGFLHDYTLTLSVIMIILEVVGGLAVLIGYKLKSFSILLILMSAFFLYLTGFALFVKGPDGTSIIKECGCFGDCIKMTNWETFIKDLVLLAFVLLIYYLRYYSRPVFSTRVGRSIVLASLAFTLVIQLYVLRHLPFVDCLPYKVGNNIPSEMTVPEEDREQIESVFIYEKDGQKEEFDIDHLPDSTWTFVDREDKVIRPATKEAKIKDFIITDINGSDITESVLTSPETVHLWIVYDLEKDEGKGVPLALKLYEEAVQNNQYMYLVCANTADDMLAYKEKYNLPSDLECCSMDGTTLKTMLRNKQGMMDIQNGNIMAKYAEADFKRHIK